MLNERLSLSPRRFFLGFSGAVDSAAAATSLLVSRKACALARSRSCGGATVFMLSLAAALASGIPSGLRNPLSFPFPLSPSLPLVLLDELLQRFVAPVLDVVKFVPRKRLHVLALQRRVVPEVARHPR